MKDLRGRNAIVTGASMGLGARVAKELAREGMNLVLAARSAETLEQVASELRGLGVKALAVPTDVSNEEHLRRLVNGAMDEFGSIDVLVNNAGIEAFRSYHELDPTDIRRTVDVNLTATLLLTRYVLPHMVAVKRGHIVNMASTAGKYGPAFGAAYGTTKAGQIAFTQALRGEYHGTGVSASAICPGFATDGGIYDVIRKRLGRGTPWWLGGTNADKVARAVVKAIKGDRPELILNRPALRPVFTICQAFPRVGEWIVRLTTRRFLKQAAESHE